MKEISERSVSIDTSYISPCTGLEKSDEGSFEFNRLLLGFEEFICADFFRPIRMNDFISFVPLIIMFLIVLSFIIFLTLNQNLRFSIPFQVFQKVDWKTNTTCRFLLSFWLIFLHFECHFHSLTAECYFRTEWT